MTDRLSEIRRRIAWAEVYAELKVKGEEYYFDNESGFLRCKAEAEAGVERAEKHWALYMLKRMQG